MTASIMAYVPASLVTVATPSYGVLPDFDNAALFKLTLGSGNTAGIRKFNSYPNGSVLLTRSIGDIGINYCEQPATITKNGLIVMPTIGNSTRFNFINTSDLTFFGSFGTSGSSLSPSTSTRILFPKDTCSFYASGVAYLVSIALWSGSPNEVCRLTIGDAAGNVNLGYTDESTALCGSAGSGALTKAFVLGHHGSTSSATPLGLYVVDSSTATMAAAKVGTIAPSDVDATWTNMTQPRGVAVDETDGNPIVFLTTGDAVATTQYIVKLSAADASVVWAAPVANLNGPTLGLSKCIIRNQVLYLLADTTHVLYTIDTSDGSVTSATIGTLTRLGTVNPSDISEDVGGSLVIDGTWSETTTSPNYIGDYMGTGGDHVIVPGESGGGAGATLRWFPATIGVDIDGAGSANPPTAPAESRKRCWTFVADGHTFYVLDLGDEGTFLYDVTTGAWCQFITSGYTRWDFLNGVMWGTRIVGGDIDTTDVWEHRASAVQDNDSLGIYHAATGKIEVRDRVHHSVGELRIAGSWGAIDDATSATMSMRFSDDNGRTWSDYFTITITPGDFSGEIAYPGLGAFMAPGRIFEISDTGGLLRIDGCDAAIDGFDEGGTVPQSR